MSTVDFITAAAALLAAILSGITLVVSGRRERARWTRDSLIEALVSFLDASFALNAASGIASLPETSHSNRKKFRTEVVKAHDIETATMTRLRLLAARGVVEAAERLHAAEHDFAHLCFQVAEAPDTDIEQARQGMREARVDFIREARVALTLRGTAAINHRHSHLKWEKFVEAAHEH